LQLYIKGTKIYNGTNASFNYINLNPDAFYEYAIECLQVDNVGGRSFMLYTLTIAYITSFTFSNFTTSSIQINFPGYYDNVILYRDGIQIYNGSDSSFNDTGLITNILYNYLVIPFNTNNVAGISISNSTSILPYFSSSFMFSNITNSSITLSYTGYYYSVVIKRDGTQIYSGNDAFFNDTGLVANKSYSYEAIPYNINNEEGSSIFGSTITLPTITSLTFSDLSYSSVSIHYSGTFNNAILYRNGTQIYSETNTNFNDIGLISNTT